jgi:hypothetical protein
VDAGSARVWGFLAGSLAALQAVLCIAGILGRGVMGIVGLLGLGLVGGCAGLVAFAAYLRLPPPERPHARAALVGGLAALGFALLWLVLVALVATFPVGE